MSFGEFFSGLVTGGLGFSDLRWIILELLDEWSAHPAISALLGSLRDEDAGSRAYLVLLLFLSVVLCFGGKRLFPAVRFCFSFVLGYVLGAVYLSQILAPVPASLVGILSASALAALARPLWFVLCILIPGGAAYVLSANVFALGVELSALLLLLISLFSILLMRRSELLLTSLMGASGIVECLRSFWDFTSVLPHSQIIVTVLVLCIGFLGALSQSGKKKDPRHRRERSESSGISATLSAKIE